MDKPVFQNKISCEDTLIVFIVVIYFLKYFIIKIPHYVCCLIVLYPLDGQKQIFLHIRPKTIECFRLDLLFNCQQVRDGADAILDHFGSIQGIYAKSVADMLHAFIHCRNRDYAKTIDVDGL